MDGYDDDCDGDTMSLFTGLLQPSKGPNSSRTAETAPACSVQKQGASGITQQPHHASSMSKPLPVGLRQQPAAAPSSSDARTFSRSKPQLALPTNSSTSRPFTATSSLIHSSSTSRTGGSYSSKPLQLGPINPCSTPTTAALAVEVPAGLQSSNSLKALSLHHLQLSDSKSGTTGKAHHSSTGTAQGQLQRGSMSKDASPPPAAGGIASSTAQQQQYSNLDALKAACAMALPPLPPLKVRQSPASAAEGPVTDLLHAADAAAVVQKKSRAVLNDQSQHHQQLVKQTLQVARPPKLSKQHTEAAAGASNGNMRPPKHQQQGDDKGKGFQLKLDLFAAGGTAAAGASKPSAGTAVAALGGASSGKSLRGSLLLPLPCSIPVSAAVASKISSKAPTAAARTAAEDDQVEHSRHAAVVSKQTKLNAVQTDTAAAGPRLDQQQKHHSRSSVQQQVLGRKRQQPKHAVSEEDVMVGIETDSSGELSDQQQQQLLHRSNHSQQQHRKHRHMYDFVSDSDADHEVDPSSSNILELKQQHYHGSKPSGQQRQQQQQRRRPQQQPRQLASAGYESEGDSELDAPSSSEPSDDSGSEWSGGNSSAANSSSSGCGGDSDDGSYDADHDDSCKKPLKSRRAATSRGGPEIGSRSKVRGSLKHEPEQAAATAATAVTGSSGVMDLNLIGLQSATAAAQSGGALQQRQQQSKKAVGWSLPPLSGRQKPAEATSAAAPQTSKQQQQLKPAQKYATAAADLGDASGALLPQGQIRLHQPSAAALARQNVLLVELPPCFDAAGDAGSIGRIVCSRQNIHDNSSSRDEPNADPSSAAAVAATATGKLGTGSSLQQLLLLPLGKSSSSVPARIASTALALGSKSSRGSKRKGGKKILDYDSEGENDNDNESDSAESDRGTDDGDDESPDDSDQSQEEDDVAADDREVTTVSLDLKGIMFSAVSLPLAGTAAVVRINMAGGNQAKASAHIEHLFNSSFVSAVAAAAPSAAAEGDDPYAADVFADDSDHEGFANHEVSALPVLDAYGLAAGFRDEEDEGTGCKTKGASRGSKGSKGSRGGKSRRGGRGGGRAAVGSKASKPRAKATAKAGGASKGKGKTATGGSKRGRGGATAAVAAGGDEVAPAKKKQKLLEPWEVSDDGSE